MSERAAKTTRRIGDVLSDKPRRLRVVIYCRVSREEQVQGYSLDAQLRAFRELCAAEGWEIAGEFVEEGRSAKSEQLRQRPVFVQVLEAADRQEYDLLVVHKLDRFSRNLRVTLECFERLGQAGVGLKSITEQFDYSTPQGRLFFHMLGTLADFYSRNLSQETKKGKAERKAQGLWNGLLPFGLVRESDQKGALPIPDRRPRETGPCNWDGLVLAFTLASDGLSDGEVARELNARGYRTTGNRGANPFTKSTVRRVLTNRIYLGELPIGANGRGGWVPGAHPAYLDSALFDAAQRARAENSRNIASLSTAPTKHAHSLTGLLACAYCLEAGRRATMQVSSTRNGVRTYCYSRNEGADCPQKSVPLSLVEDQVADWLRGIEVDEASVERALAVQAERTREVADPAAERQRLESRLERIRNLYSWGDLEEAAYLAEREEIRARLAALAPQPEQRRSLEALAALARSAHAAWTAGRPAERHRLLTRLVERVVVRDGKAEAIIPRPVLRDLLPEWLQSSRPGGSDGERCAAAVIRRYTVPHSIYSADQLRAVALSARAHGISGASREHGVARQTVRRAIGLYGER